MLKFNNLKYKPGAKKKFKRVGRGHSSGHGKTCCRGHKGQNSRTGGGTRPGFEGGQTPLYRRLPKQNKFKNLLFRKEYAIINVGSLNNFNEGEELTCEILRGKFLKGKPALIKILGGGELKKRLAVQARQFSESAKTKIEAAGGKVIIK